MSTLRTTAPVAHDAHTVWVRSRARIRRATSKRRTIQARSRLFQGRCAPGFASYNSAVPPKTGQARKLLGQILKEMGLVDEGQLQEALAEQRRQGGALGEILIRKGVLDMDTLTLALAAQNGMEVITSADLEVPPDLLRKIPANLARGHGVLPIRYDGNTLIVAMSNPNDINTLDDLRLALRMPVRGAVAPRDAVWKAIDKYYGEKAGSSAPLLADAEPADLRFLGKAPQGGYDIEAADAEGVALLLNRILAIGIKAQASDIHLEAFEDTFRVRYRVDGVLYEMQSPPKELAQSLVTRIKVLAGMDISETRLPQDGRRLVSLGGRTVDLRISTLPTIGGESVVLRILDRSVVNLSLENLGFREDDLRQIEKLLDLPHGVVVVTGPTGSGKTTTLYSALNRLNDLRWKIVTTEDPVEYEIDGIVQCSVNDEIGVTYSNLLRSILRHDPDVILVGEIRDLETAQIAIQASLTGHLVFTTLHTNDAPTAITRLVDLGVEPFLICATLDAVLAQRLVRRICPDCKVSYSPTEEMLIRLNVSPDQIRGKQFCRGKGCGNCNGTGYRGRLALGEIMLLSDRLRDLIMSGASTDQIRRAAKEEGMRTLRESGLLAIFDGHTTIEEVARETMFSEEL